MRATLELFEMYKEEKALVIGGPKERTGLEPFPTFDEWKKEYMQDYERLHVTVSAKEAKKLTEEEIAQAELELEGVNFETDLTIKRKEVSGMTEETAEMTAAGAATAEVVEPSVETETTTEAPVTEPTPEPTPAKGKAKGKSKAAKPKEQKPKRKTKADEARKIFGKLYPKVREGKKTRKEVVTELQEKAGLTAAGAATYYQKFKAAADAEVL